MSDAIVRLDHRNEFDELIVEKANVHIERLDTKAFWIGIYPDKGAGWMVNTGVDSDGNWFFNVEEDDDNPEGGRSFMVSVAPTDRPEGK